MSDRTSTTEVAGLTARPLVLADAAALAEMYTEIERAEPADEHTDADEVAQELDGPTVDLERASLGLFDGSTLVAAILVSRLNDGERFKAYLQGGVSPAWWRRGLGTRLTRVGEELAAQWKRHEAPDLPGELEMWVEQNRVSTGALVDALGYTTRRYFFRMQRQLDDAIEIPPAPPGFVIRRYTTADDEPTRIARNESFRDHWGSMESSVERWTHHMTGAPEFRPEHSFVATAAHTDGDRDSTDSGVAAFILTEEFDSETTARGYRTAYVALVGTVRSARGHGLASALLARQLSSVAEAGYRVAELSVDSESPTGAGKIYQRHGFEVLDRHRAVGKDLP